VSITTQQGEEMNDPDLPRYVILETTNTQGKQSWAIWERDSQSNGYSYLVARVYDPVSAGLITTLLNANNKESK
jgi:hypothetical protein